MDASQYEIEHAIHQIDGYMVSPKPQVKWDSEETFIAAKKELAQNLQSDHLRAMERRETMNTEPKVDANDAPQGYYAVPKALFAKKHENICRFCDWRHVCTKPETNTLAPGQNCRGYELISSVDGLTYKRADGVAVLFKLLPAT